MSVRVELTNGTQARDRTTERYSQSSSFISPVDDSMASTSMVYWMVISALFGLIIVEASTAWPVGPGLNDFGAFLGIGRALRAGIPPYLVLPTTPTVLIKGFWIPWPNANPPALLPVLYLISAFPPLAAFRAWFVVCLGLYCGLVVMLLRAYPSWRTPLGVTLLGAFLPFWASEERGQIYVPLALMAAAAWLALVSGKTSRAGILIGALVALKPNFAVWPAALLLAGFTSTAMWATFTAAALSAIPAIIYGPVIYAQWFAAIKVGDSVDMGIVSSVFGIGAIVGAPVLGNTIGLALSIAIIVALACWAYRTKPTVLQASALGIVAALVVGPITWHGYGLLLLPILLSRRWSWTLALALALSFLPFNILPFFALVGLDVIRRGDQGLVSAWSFDHGNELIPRRSLVYANEATSVRK